MDSSIINDLIVLFEKANASFVSQNIDQFEINVSERSLCAELKSKLEEEIKRSEYADYYVQTEYNRYWIGEESNKKITTYDDDLTPKTIVCDLIVHGRGMKRPLDNLIVLEMKKSTASNMKKMQDKKRLKALTAEEDVIPISMGVRGYQLGIYYEINRDERKIYIEYYSRGRKIENSSIIPF